MLTAACCYVPHQWRREGLGELYLYVPRFQDPDYCAIKPRTLCGGVFGDSIGRGSFAFTAGNWTRLRQYVQLNTFDEQGRPVRDGIIILWVAEEGQEFSSEPAIEYRKLVLRTDPCASFAGIRFESFQGGISKDFAAPKSQRAYFRNIKLYAY